MFFFMSIIFCSLSFFMMDPMKSSFFLIMTLMIIMPLISFSMHIWYSYFISLLFLSGIFVILVYFSSLSKINFVKSHFLIFSFILSVFYFILSFSFLISNLNLSVFYFSFYMNYIMFLVMFLLMYMNFCSYFLNFSGALRKL